jgi:hypothetical protein
VARVLFAAAQPASEFGLNWNSYPQKWQAVAQKWYERLSKDAVSVSTALAQYRQKNQKLPEANKVLQT